MSLTKYPNGVSSFGLPVIGGRFTSTGRAFFVNSNTGSNSYDGRDKDHPKDTIANALAVATSEKGDVIYVMPGHAESINSTVACQVQKSCIKLIGLGHGANRPQLTFHSSGVMSVESDNFTMENFLLLGCSTAAEKPISVAGKHCMFRNLEWREAKTTIAGYKIIETTSDVAGFSLDGFKYFGSSAADVAKSILSFKSSTTGTERFTLKNIAIAAHDNATAGAGIVHMDTSSPPLSLYMQDCAVCWNGASTGGFCYKLGTTDTATGKAVGMAIRVYAGCNTDDYECALFGSSSGAEELTMGFFDCYTAGLPGEAGAALGITTASTA